MNRNMAAMLPETIRNLEYVTEHEIIEAYEARYGPLPPAKQCPKCGTWWVVNAAKQLAGPNRIFCSPGCAKAAHR